MIGLVFVGIGIIALIVIVLLKQKINNFYDNMIGLSAAHAKFYKNVVIFLVPFIFIVIGMYFFITENIGYDFKQNITEKINLPQISGNFIVGVLAAIFGLVTLIIRLTKYKYKAFSKLSVMEEKYGRVAGNIIHIIGYTIVPIIFGIVLFLDK